MTTLDTHTNVTVGGLIRTITARDHTQPGGYLLRQSVADTLRAADYVAETDVPLGDGSIAPIIVNNRIVVTVATDCSGAGITSTRNHLARLSTNPNVTDLICVTWDRRILEHIPDTAGVPVHPAVVNVVPVSDYIDLFGEER